MTTSPPAITSLPVAPDPSDRSTFNARAYPWSAALPTFGTQVSAVGDNVKSNADEAVAAAVTATTKEALTNADAIATAADRVQTGLDRIATAADVVAATALLDAFDDRYLGAKATDPALDNDGNALIEGAQYFNTTIDRQKYYTGAAWNVSFGDSVDVTHTPAGTGAVSRTTQSKLRESVSVKDFGAVGDGVTNDLPAIQKAVDHLTLIGGGTLYLPAGHYYGPKSTGDGDANGFVLIQGSGITFQGDGNSTRIDFAMKIRGTTSNPVNVGATAFGSGSETVYLAESLGLSVGDYVQLWGVCHPYSTDAGDYQLGGVNPTYNSLYAIRFGEFSQVSTLTSSTQFVASYPVTYPKYQNSTAGLTTTIAGVTSAQAVKVDFVDGFTLRDCSYSISSYTSFDMVFATYVKNMTVENVTFDVLDASYGQFITFTSCLDLNIVNCAFNRSSTAGAYGSSWNTIIGGGGSMAVTISDCSFTSEWQTIDITPGISPDFLIENPAFVGSYLTYTGSSISNCTFNNCTDAGTWHPGGMYSRYSNNTVHGGGGLRLRSRQNIVTGNIITSDVSCISLSAFYDDTLIAGNSFVKPDRQDAAKDAAIWVAVNMVNFGSESNNGNTPENVVVSNNTFINKSSSINQPAIQIRHNSNGAANPTSGMVMTTTELGGRSDIYITGNHFDNCYVEIAQYHQGVEIRGNKFYGNSAPTNGFIYHQNNTGGTVVSDNFFESATGAIVLPVSQSGSVTWLPWTISRNSGRGPVTVTNSSIGTRSFNFLQLEDTVYADVIKTSSGMGIKAIRASGAATLNLDAEATDGTSNVDVRVFGTNTTTGTKTLAVTGRVSSENSYPRTDNTYTSGLSTLRWSTVYSATGTINTSDSRVKQDIEALDAAEKRVALEIKGMLKKFRFKDAVAEKGAAARIHVGVIAQEVEAAFESEGLDAAKYALLCYDEWDAEFDDAGVQTLAAGSRYGVRYEELLAFIIGAM